MVDKKQKVIYYEIVNMLTFSLPDVDFIPFSVTCIMKLRITTVFL